jgi:hypothetical protein
VKFFEVPKQENMMRMLLPFVLAGVVSADCNKTGYTCCGSISSPYKIPIFVSCIQDEPNGTDNCHREGLRKVPAELDEKWHSCSNLTKRITRADIEKEEKRRREYDSNYEKNCGKSAPKCAALETCYYNGGHYYATGLSFNADIKDKGRACVCSLDDVDQARANPDGTGECVVCSSGPAGTPRYKKFVRDEHTLGMCKTFHNGECACAFGPKKSDEQVLV